MSQSMKLVDILARGMKVWPEEATYCESYMCTRSLYFVDDNHRIILRSEIQVALNEFQKVTREQWHAAVDALTAPAWSGEGLPPIGAACEFQGDIATCPSDPWKKGLHDGLECRVIAHFKSKSLDLVAFTFTNPDGNTEVEQALPGALRPIRTAEQIAAAEREAWIQNFCNDLDVPHAIGSRAYDAGYRKQADQ